VWHEEGETAEFCIWVRGVRSKKGVAAKGEKGGVKIDERLGILGRLYTSYF